MILASYLVLQEVAITVQGKTEYATVRDECPGCGEYDLFFCCGR